MDTPTTFPQPQSPKLQPVPTSAASDASSQGKPVPVAPAGGRPAGRLFDTQQELDAQVVRTLLLPSALSAIIGCKTVGKAGVKLAFDDFIEQAGAPTDPVEVCLLEQLFLVHNRLAMLQAQAAEAKTLEEAKVYNSAAARLLAEFRRLALAIRQYRQPTGSRTFSVIHQQNVATAGGQQEVKYVDDKGEAKAQQKEAVAAPKVPTAEDDLLAMRERVAQGRKALEEVPVA